MSDLQINVDEKKTADDQDDEKEADAASVRKSCVEILKNVQNNLYATENVHVLCNVKEHLNELDMYLNEEMPKICGMPIRAKRRQSNVRSRQPHKVITIGKANERIIPVDSDIIPEPEMEYDNLNTELIPFIEGLHNSLLNLYHK